MTDTQEAVLQRIITNDSRTIMRDDPAGLEPMSRQEVADSLPTWINATDHDYALLMAILSRMQPAMESAEWENQLSSLLIPLEHVCAGTVTISPEDKVVPGSQQTADAWFHKCTIYFYLSERVSGKRDAFMRAASNCINNALANPSFVQPQFQEMKDKLSDIFLGNLRQGFGLSRQRFF